jgi:ornithine cyclodeaminase
MTDILSLNQIKARIAKIGPAMLLQSMEDGFTVYSEKQCVVPPAGHLGFKNPPGDVHIKYGYIQDDEVYVVKVASSFYDNSKFSLPSSNGTMLVFSQKTGVLQTVLLDEGYLTDLRTALAGAVAAKYLAPSNVYAIGIVGTGTQARFQLQFLKEVLACRKVYVYGRSEASVQKYIEDMQEFGYEIIGAQNIADITNNCNYIVTTTPSNEPLIVAEQVRAGTHITAMGSDGPGKQELDAAILAKADMLVVDSLSQCEEYGETAHALQQGLIENDKAIELGVLIKRGLRRESDAQITVTDLTGVAVQDIQIAKLIAS